MSDFESAVESWDKGNYPKALELVNRALDSQPNHGEGWYLKARIHRKLEQPHEALFAINRAVELATGKTTGDISAWILKLNILTGLDKEAEAASFTKKGFEGFGE